MIAVPETVNVSAAVSDSTVQEAAVLTEASPSSCAIPKITEELVVALIIVPEETSTKSPDFTPPEPTTNDICFVASELFVIYIFAFLPFYSS
jgi:hypothetical protein